MRCAPVYRLRGDLLPLVDLREVFGRPAPRGPRATIAVLQTDTVRFGLLVDRVLNTEEIVVKPLSARLKVIGLFAGATLMGDGQVALILDIQGLARPQPHRGEPEQARRRPRATRGPRSRSSRCWWPGSATAAGWPSRCQRSPGWSGCRPTCWSTSAAREVMQYRGAITPVVRLDRVLGSMTDTREEIVVVVYSRADRAVAIVVDEIVDIVDDVATQHSELATTDWSARRSSRTA